MTIDFVSYFTGAVELGGRGKIKVCFCPPPHFFVEEIYISGQIKQKTLFCSIQKFHSLKNPGLNLELFFHVYLFMNVSNKT
jgi:hypothetical protein